MIWLVTAALAQDSLFDGPKNDCRSDGRPIVGTAGVANTLEAYQTTASTYSASSYLEQRVFPRLAADEDGKGGVAAMEANWVYGVSRVPMINDVSADGCPVDYLVAARSVDLYAYNAGGAFHYGRFGAFYGASVIFGYPAELTYLRAYQSFGSLALGPAFLGGALFGSYGTSAGASAYAQDLVAGMVVDADLVDLRAGYTRSRGWYASARERTFGLFGSLVLRDGLSLVGQLKAGADRVKYPDAVRRKVGTTSAFARILPLSVPTEDETGQQRQLDLTTGHLEQESLFGVADVRLAYAVRPVAQLHQASIAIHDRGYHEAANAEDSDDLGDKDRMLYAEAGVVTLPPMYYDGLPGGTFVHGRFDAVFPIRDGDEAVAYGSFGLQINDPEFVSLYPFATNAVAFRASVQGF